MMKGQLGLSKMTATTQDVLDALNKHSLHGLRLCELSGHFAGLHMVRGWKGDNPKETITELLAAVNRLEPSLRLQLISGSYPTYAFIGGQITTDAIVGPVMWIRELDAREIAKRRRERSGLTLSLQWGGRKVMLGNLHNPHSTKRKWKSTEQHEEIIGNLIARLLGPASRSGGAREPTGSSQTSGGAEEPAGEPCNCAWALGGDFNIGPPCDLCDVLRVMPRAKTYPSLA